MAADNLLRDLATRGYRISEAGLAALFEPDGDEASPKPPARSLDNAIALLLQSDFRDIEYGDVLKGTEMAQTFDGPLVLQVLGVQDISVPSDRTTQSSHRLLRLILTDGHSKRTAIEYLPFEGLKTSHFTPGVKICIVGTVKVRLGIFLLTAENVRVVGGSVESLAVAYRVGEASKGRQRGEKEAGATAPPVFEPYGGSQRRALDAATPKAAGDAKHSKPNEETRGGQHQGGGRGRGGDGHRGKRGGHDDRSGGQDHERHQQSHSTLETPTEETPHEERDHARGRGRDRGRGRERGRGRDRGRGKGDYDRAQATAPAPPISSGSPAPPIISSIVSAPQGDSGFDVDAHDDEQQYQRGGFGGDRGFGGRGRDGRRGDRGGGRRGRGGRDFERRDRDEDGDDSEDRGFRGGRRGGRGGRRGRDEGGAPPQTYADLLGIAGPDPAPSEAREDDDGGRGGWGGRGGRGGGRGGRGRAFRDRDQGGYQERTSADTLDNDMDRMNIGEAPKTFTMGPRGWEVAKPAAAAPAPVAAASDALPRPPASARILSAFPRDAKSYPARAFVAATIAQVQVTASMGEPLLHLVLVDIADTLVCAAEPALCRPILGVTWSHLQALAASPHSGREAAIELNLNADDKWSGQQAVFELSVLAPLHLDGECVLHGMYGAP